MGESKFTPNNLPKDFALEVACGRVAGVTAIHKFGANPTVDAGTTEKVAFSGVINFLTAATTVRVKAGNAADTTDGAGARKVMVVGLDNTWGDAEEELVTAGGSASSATTKSFFRVFRAFVTDVGTYGGANTGDVVIENSGGGTDLVTIAAGDGQSEEAHYTVPLSKTGYLTRWGVSVDSNRACDMKFYQRRDADDVSAPFTGERLVLSALQLIGTEGEDLTAYLSFPAKTDLYWEATAPAGGAAAVAADWDMYVVDD